MINQKTKLGMLFLYATISGCADRNDHLAEIDPNFTEKCAPFSTETKLTYKANNQAASLIKDIEQYWEKSDQGKQLISNLRHNDNILCSYLQNSAYNEITYDEKTNTYTIGSSINSEQFAIEILLPEITKNFEDTVELSDELVPEDALLLSRVKEAHRHVVIIEEVAKMSTNSFASSIWTTFEDHLQYGSIATNFQQDMTTKGYTQFQALTNTFIDTLSDRNNFTATDASFLEWYDEYLHDRTEIGVSICTSVDFDGNISTSPCTTTETVPPSETTASRLISPEDISDLTATFGSKTYLEGAVIQDIIATNEFRKITPQNAERYAQVIQSAEECCKDNTREAGSKSRLIPSMTKPLSIPMF